jgi:hypothetical protein
MSKIGTACPIAARAPEVGLNCCKAAVELCLLPRVKVPNFDNHLRSSSKGSKHGGSTYRMLDTQA